MSVTGAGLKAARQSAVWLSRSAHMVPLYRNWPVAVADRVLLRGQDRTYRLSARDGGARLVARSWADTRIINELWIDDPYLGQLPSMVDPTLIVDVGANRGYFCVQAARRFPSATVLAYEPEPANLELLATNLELNGLRQVEVRPIALVPDDREEVELFEAVHPGYHSTLSPQEHTSRGLDTERFTGRSLRLSCANVGEEMAHIIDEHGPVTLLKIDTEGTELDLLDALPDAVLAATSNIVAEIEEEPGAALLARLHDAGFHVEQSRYYLTLTRSGSPR